MQVASIARRDPRSVPRLHSIFARRLEYCADRLCPRPIVLKPLPLKRGPASKVLTSTGTLVNDGATLLYRASKRDCDICELKPRCCPKIPARKVPRSIYESASDVARGIARTEAYVTSRRERKKIEMLFAHLKRILRLDRLRLRGPCGARDEFLLAATAQNLRKLAKLIPPPAPMSI